MENSNITESFVPYIIALWKKRVLIIIASTCVTIIAIFYAFFVVEKQYKAHVSFFPPMAHSSSEILSTFGININPNKSIDPYQINDIFKSEQLRRSVIDKFNLIEKYNLEESENKYVLALKRLSNDITITMNEIGAFGMSKLMSYTISTLHTSKDTTYLMADFAFKSIDSIIVHINTQSARNEIDYLNTQISVIDSQLIMKQKEFNKFQIENKAYNLPDQISLSIQNYSNLKSQIVQNKIKIKTLRLMYNKDAAEIIKLKNTNSILERELKKIEVMEKASFFPGLNIASNLLMKYNQLYIDIETFKNVLSFLNQQLIQSNLKESRIISGLSVIDEPVVPEYKYKPKRVFLMAIIILPSIMMLLLFILLFDLHKRVFVKSEFYKKLINEIKNK